MWRLLTLNHIEEGLAMYKTFIKNVEYLHGVSDAGTRSLLKLRSGTCGLNEELGRHSGRDGKLECY